MREVIEVVAPQGEGPKGLKLNPGIKQSTGGLLSIDRNLHRELFCKEPLESVYAVDPEPLARGKFATVRRCVQLATGREFAAKLVRKRGRKRVPGLDSFIPDELIHEVAVLTQSLHCPQIVTLHHVFDSPNELVLILELARGGDLQTILDEDRIPSEVDAAKCLRDVLKGLSFLHRHDLAHLDIKPQNIVLNGDFPKCDVKLCDFGISRLITNGAEVREIMGTPDYVAPEVLNYEPISLATDMWSVGVLTYVLLTGCSPFGGETKQDTFCNITKAIVDFPEDLFADISDNAKDFILRLLIKKPSDRMKVDECLRHPWLKCGKPEIPRPDSIPILPRQESCPACGSGNTTPVNTPSSFLNDTQQSPRGRRLSNLHPSTDSLDSDTSVETVKAAHNGTRRMIPDDEEEEEDLDGDLNASKRYSASTETVTSSSSSSSNSIGINGNRASMTTSMTSLRSPYSRRRSSMESLTPRFSASIRSIPESMIRASVAATSAEVEEDAGFEAREEEEELPIDQETIRRTEMVALYGSRSAENRKRRSSPATRFSLGHNTRLFPMLGEDDVDSPDDSVPCKNENVPSSPLKSDDDQVPTHGRCFLTAGEDTRRAFSVPAAFDPPDSEPGLLPTRLMMTAATTTTTTDAHNHSQSCCDDLSDSRGSVNVTNGGSQQRHHHPHYHHLLHFQQQQFHANNRQPQFPAPPPKESSPRLSRLSSETSSERSSGVFSDYSELSSDSSSDRSSVMSWEEAADAGSNHMGGCSAVGAPRFQNALEERFFELNLWETVWDEVALRNRRGTCPGRRGSADAHKPWEKVCSGIVARAQAQIATKSTRKAPTSAANNSSANCRSLGRSLGHTVSRSITRLHEKGQMVGPLPTTTTSTGSQDAVVQKASPKKPTRAPPMPPVAVVVVGTPCVRKLSAAFDNSSKVAHAR